MDPLFPMKILVADKISPKGVAFLRQQPGFEVIEAYGSSPEKVLDAGQGCSCHRRPLGDEDHRRGLCRRAIAQGRRGGWGWGG